MNFISQGLIEAVNLIISGNSEALSAIRNTIEVTTVSIITASALGLPAGFMLGYFDFPGKKFIRTLFDTLLAMPTVVVGLIVYAFITERGPLGGMEMLFEKSGIILGQVALILPIIISLTASAIETLDPRLHSTLLSLGAHGRRIIITGIVEARFAILAGLVTAYGRVLSEVGVSMMVGGNIKWHTRTITTAIALETGKGEFALGMALGIVLLAIGLSVNIALLTLKRKA